jgi:hypothetical protein
MDNLTVHQAHGVREAIEAIGAKLVFLPPYFQNSRRLNCVDQNSSNYCVLLKPEPAKHLTQA